MNAEQYEAELAAEQDADVDLNKLVWICAGFFGNIIGILLAFIYQPTPPLSRIYEKSDVYQMFYRDAYKIKIRTKQLTYACIGFGVLAAIYVLFFGFTLISMFTMFDRINRMY